MHIALTDNESICSKCESVMKENNPPDTKLIKEKSQATPLSRYQKTFSRSRQSKSKLRCTFGNQHRLDHTYAAAINFNEVVPSTSNEQSTKKAPISKESSSQKLQSQSVLCEKQNSIIDNNYRTNDKATDSEQSSPSSSNDEISLKSSWLRNLFHLEYQPTKNIDKLEAEQLDDALREKRSSPRLSGNSLRYNEGNEIS